VSPTSVSTTARAMEAVRRCRLLSACSEEPGVTTRTFLSAPMRVVHAYITRWMEVAGMTVGVDAAGNIRGVYGGRSADAPRLFIGSHLDSVPSAGAFDGVLGVMLGLALVESLDGRRLRFAIEVVGFSEEEGVRFGAPFIGSRALAGTLDEPLLMRLDADGHSVADAITAYGLDLSAIPRAAAGVDAAGYLEFHIEQGPLLDWLGLPLGLVESIVGQSRLSLTFTGTANHAGTTPMDARRDALAGAAEWISEVERTAAATLGLVATVGRVVAEPGAGNVIAGRCDTSLDVRHADDATRSTAVASLLERARAIAARRRLDVHHEVLLEQAAVPMDTRLTAALARAVAESGVPVHRMASGSGHDAMIVAARMPAAMLFVRSPGGVSHHPDEAVSLDDVAAAMHAGSCFLDILAESWP
jgi:allantoate deiminase